MDYDPTFTLRLRYDYDTKLKEKYYGIYIYPSTWGRCRNTLLRFRVLYFSSRVLFSISM